MYYRMLLHLPFLRQLSASFGNIGKLNDHVATCPIVIVVAA